MHAVKRVRAVGEFLPARDDVGEALMVADELVGGFGIEAGLAGGGFGLTIVDKIAVGPLDRVAGQAEEALVHGVGGAGHGLPLGGEGEGRGVDEGDAGVGCPGACSAGGADERRAFAGVDGDLQTGALRGKGGGEAESTAAEDGEFAEGGLSSEGSPDGDLGRAPGERPAASPVAVVVDDELVAEALGVHARTGGAEGAQADGDAEDAVEVSADRGEGRDGVVEGEGGWWSGRGNEDAAGAAGEA